MRAPLLPILPVLLALAAALGPAAVGAQALPPVPAARLAPAVAAQPVPGVEIRYELLAPDRAATGPARLQGKVEAPGGRLLSSVRIDPAGDRRVGRLDTRWEMRGPGLLQTVVVGDTWSSGSGWSEPQPLGGLRIGRPVALRSRQAAPPPLVPPPLGFTPAGGINGDGFGPGGAKPAGPVPPPVPLQPPTVVAQPLPAGASDHELEVGRMREGHDTAQPSYGPGYAAGAWRKGIGGGLTAEARAEWTAARQATGVELLQQLGGGTTLQALVAQSGTAQEPGLRWGLGLVRSAAGATWNVGVDAAEREYVGVAGAAAPRTGVRAGTRLALSRRFSADLGYSRSLGWDAQAPDVALSAAARMALPSRASLAMDVSHREGPQAGWRAGVSLTVPLQATR